MPEEKSPVRADVSRREKLESADRQAPPPVQEMSVTERAILLAGD